jgi:DNA-binding transcriptional MerR regulator
MRNKSLIKADTLCSINEVALTLNLTVRRIRQLQALGILPRSVTRGKYNLVEVTRAYTAYQRQRIRQLQATGKRQRQFKKLSPAELETWRNRVNAQLQEFSERLMNLRKRNDISDLDNIKLDLSEFEKKKR